jgi:uncharacterized protein YjcR
MVDWVAAANEYVNGLSVGGDLVYPTARELARKHGVQASTITRRAKRYGWQDQRTQHQIAALFSIMAGLGGDDGPET